VTRRYRAFLALPGASRLLLSSLLARLPLGMSSLAVLLLVRQRTGSFASAGIAVGAFTLTGAAAAPVQGALVDRYGGRLVLLPCAIAHGAWLSALVIAADAGGATAELAVFAGIAGACGPPIEACSRVMWPVLAPEPELLEAAYQLDATSQEVIWTLGPLLVAAAVLLGSPGAAVLLSVAIVVVGTAVFVTGPLRPGSRGRARGPLRRSPLRSPGLRVLLAATLLMGLGIGAVEIGLPALAVRSGSRGATGLLLALWSVGSMLGGLAYGARTWSSPVAVRYPALLLFVAVATAPLILASSLAAAIPLSALAGVGYAPMLACEYALVGALAPSEMATEAYTWTSAALVAGLAGGAAVAGAVVQSSGVAGAFVLGSVSTGLAGVLAAAGRGWIGAGIARRPAASPPASASATAPATAARSPRRAR
jgi:MFS family permease